MTKTVYKELSEAVFELYADCYALIKTADDEDVEQNAEDLMEYIVSKRNDRLNELNGMSEEDFNGFVQKHMDEFAQTGKYFIRDTK